MQLQISLVLLVRLLFQVQKTMKENLVAIEENFAALDQRMKKLSK